MTKAMKAPVSARAVIQRINRRLKPELEALKISRSERMRQSAGKYFVIDYRANMVTHIDVDPETFARELEVLREWEAVSE